MKKFFALSLFYLCALYGKTEKDWTIITYIASDNDLNFFARKNMDDMAKVGSNKWINILTQVDAQHMGYTKRFYIEKHKITQVNQHDASGNQKLDFGSATTLIDCLNWAIENYPAKHYALVLWNHGIGILDNISGRSSDPSQLFNFNLQTSMLEINRSIGYFDFIKNNNKRGVCFSDTFGTYLTNKKLNYALQAVTTKHGKKIDIIGFDACLMGMFEMAQQLEPFANYMTASQELELGTGWPYAKVLEPFIHQTLSPEEFSKHIVEAYHQNYKNITYDYTLSTVDLSNIPLVHESLNQTADLLLNGLQYQVNSSITKLIRASKSKRLCTHFSEPSYIDMHHFLSNLFEAIEFVELQQGHESIQPLLKESLNKTILYLEQAIIANQCGRNLARARGLSIYFPIRYIDHSYYEAPFVQTARWIFLLQALS